MLSEFDIRHRPITPAFFHSYGTNLSLMTEEISLMSIPRGWWLVFASKIYFPSVQISLHQRFFVTYEKTLHVHLIKYIKKKCVKHSYYFCLYTCTIISNNVIGTCKLIILVVDDTCINLILESILNWSFASIVYKAFAVFRIGKTFSVQRVHDTCIRPRFIFGSIAIKCRGLI